MSKAQEFKPWEVDKDLTVQAIRESIPKEYFVKCESRFLISVLFSVSATLACAYMGYNFIPQTIYFLPVWILYAAVTGTVATGVWVLGHECGHKAFSDNDLMNDILGFILHTPLLVPYFSWQHSHHVHHSKCNHTEIGETHVPLKTGSKSANTYNALKEIIGVEAFAWLNINLISWLGWPLYLLLGITGGPERGFTSHFIVPNKLFPQEKLVKVGISNVGLLVMAFVIYQWIQATSFCNVMAVYGGPYLIVNVYLTIYTFMHHTDKDVPHYDHKAWTWLRGAVGTIDRNYPAFINALHFDIGSTHVTHHIFHELPHYNADKANIYVKEKLGKYYNYDSKNIFKSLFECAGLISISEVEQAPGVWKFVQ